MARVGHVHDDHQEDQRGHGDEHGCQAVHMYGVFSEHGSQRERGLEDGNHGPDGVAEDPDYREGLFGPVK